MVIMIDVTHGVWHPAQTGLTVMTLEFMGDEALPVQAYSQKFAATPGDALAALE